jgi:TrmH family RNA methyltransferase
MKSWKDNISFILIEPREPGNIGSSARALKNMGFKNIELVKPVHFFTVEARFMACDAVDVLEQAIVHSDLKDAIKDKSLVIGTTRRLGKQRGLIIPVKESIKRIIQTAKKNRVAILFGREDKGLSNKEVEKCGFLITIPTNSSSPSLNLAQSILLVAYELSQKEYTGTIPAIIKLEELENF